jgi:hypothetical protein
MNSSLLKISLSNLMQGAHQSEPEKTKMIFLFEAWACFFASSKLDCQF